MQTQPSPANPPHGEILGLLAQAECLAREGRYDQAEDAFGTAVASDEHGHARIGLGCFLMSRDRHAEAIAAFREALRMARLRSDHGMRAIASHNLAAVLRDVGEWPLARRFQRQSEVLGQLAAEQPGGTLAGNRRSDTDPAGLTNSAIDAVVAGDLKQARQRLSAALEGKEANGSLVDKAADWGNLGVIAMLEADWGRAAECFRKARQWHRATGDDRGLGCDLMNLGELCFRLGRYQAAVRFFRRAAVCLKRASAPRLVAKARLLRCNAERAAGVRERDLQLN